MEAKLFTEPPEFTRPEWYAGRERAPHLEQGGHRGRLDLAARYARLAATEHGCRTVSDLGAGDGGLLSLIASEFEEAWGYDLQPANVEGAKERGVTVHLCDMAHPAVNFGDLSVCTEVLEHLIDPHGLVRALPSPALVASSPAFETADSHYAYHTWCFDMDGYRALVEQGGYRVVRHEITGDFQVLLGVRP